jgi:hypothetical protein
MTKRILLSAATAAMLAASAPQTQASDYSKLLQPAKPGMPLAHPIAANDIMPPPLSLIADRPVRPAYVPGLPGLPQNRVVADDFGRKPPKFDAVFIRKSRVENGEVVIPAGGLVYHEDTWGGEVALRGEPIPMLGRLPTYVDYDMSIVVKEDVTIPAGQSVAVGGQVYQYYATVVHNKTANHTLHVKTIAGTDWEWAFGSPVLSPTQTDWWNGLQFAQLYNQGKAKEVTPQKMVFEWISGVRMDRVVLADEKVFAGLGGAGDEWKTGNRIVRVASIDTAAGTVNIEVVENGNVVLAKTLGPVQNDLLIEDTGARKALVFEHGDVIGFLSPWPEPFRDGKANLKIYAKAFSLRYGGNYAGDKRFTVYPVGCPTGHNFGFMLVNKEEIRLKPGQSVDGPEGYFKVAVDAIDGDKVLAWHVADKQGNRSANLGGPTITNVDLVLGQGRVAGQAILKDVGRQMLERTYVNMASAGAVQPAPALAAAPSVPAPAQPAAAPQHAAPSAPLSPGLLATFGVLALGVGAIGYEVGRRRKPTP